MAKEDRALLESIALDVAQAREAAIDTETMTDEALIDYITR